MGARAADEATTVRAAEVAASLSLASDIGMGFPLEHGLRTTLAASRLAERLGVDAETAAQTFYVGLLAHAGCTADAHVTADVFGDSLTAHLHPVVFGSQREVLAGLLRALPPRDSAGVPRMVEIVRRLPRAAREQRPHISAMCEVAQMMAEAVGAPPPVRRLLSFLMERWDGKGPLRRAEAEDIPLPMRIVHVAMDATSQRLLAGNREVARIARARAGHGLDPHVAACLTDDVDAVLAVDPHASAWEETLASEPGPRRTLEGEAIDRALTAVGSFADLLSPHLSGHCTAVAELADAAAARCGLDPGATTVLHRAALVHDLGRVAVDPAVWQQPGPLSADAWEQVRLHPYHTERVLSRSPFLAALAPVAGAHHERLDGSGYHRGSAARDQPVTARLLAAADAYAAMTAPRPHRDRLPPGEAGAQLAADVSAGQLDPDAVTAVIEAAGQGPLHVERPAGLTERESEVVAMLARGLQTKQVGRTLGISAKTADRHIQNAYAKMGVSSRAAATLFAMEHGLVAWGELPMSRASPRS